MNMQKKKVICGVQQVGIGVENAAQAWAWYNKHLGFDVKILGDDGVAERMLPYTGGKPQPRFALIVVNLRGGGGLEVWEPKGRELKYLDELPMLGDLGVVACKLKSRDPKAAYEQLKAQGVRVLTTPTLDPSGKLHFFILDPWDNLFDIEEDSYCLLDEDKNIGGNNGATIGVADIDRSVAFYKGVMDYDLVLYDRTGVFEDLKGVSGGECAFRRVCLAKSGVPAGPLSPLLGTSRIELIQRLDGPAPKKLYEGRYWGDPGFIQICFDVRNMEKVREAALEFGHDFVCDGGRDFKMGESDGHFTYIEDPDGTLIEFVETFKIPIIKKLGVYLHLEKRDDRKPLPAWMLKLLRFMKTKTCE